MLVGLIWFEFDRSLSKPVTHMELAVNGSISLKLLVWVQATTESFLSTAEAVNVASA